MTATTPKQAFSVSEFCASYGVSRGWLYARWTSNDGPPRCRVAGKVLIPRDGADAWLKDHAAPLAA